VRGTTTCRWVRSVVGGLVSGGVIKENFRRSGPRWTPVAPILIAVASIAVAIAGAFLLRGTSELARISGPPLFIVGQLGLALAMFRATKDRADHFAAAGVPPAWTRPGVRGVTDTDLRRWDNTLRELREPWPGDGALLTAARARVAGLPLIVVLGVLPLVLAAAGVVLGLREPNSLLTVVAFPNFVIGLLLCLAAVRYGVDGRRARSYLSRFGDSAAR
jgi:hypothetical protein